MSFYPLYPAGSIVAAYTATPGNVTGYQTDTQMGRKKYSLVLTSNGWIAQGGANTAVQSVSASSDTLTTALAHGLATGFPLQVAALGDTAVSKAFQIAAGGAIVDVTTALNNATANDVTPFATGVANDYFAVGYTTTYGPLKLQIGTAGTVGVVVWEYWNGSAWTALSGVTDNTNSFKAAAGTYTVVSTAPADWATTSINGSAQLYFIRARVTTPFTVNPLLTQGWVDGTLPTGLSASTTYFVIATSATTFQLATTYANASAGTAIDITTNNGGITTSTVATKGNGSTYIPANTYVPVDGSLGAVISVLQDSAGGNAILTPTPAAS